MRSIILAVSLLFFSTAVYADLYPWKDYEPSQEVYLVTTIKVESNMGDAYLEGLRDTWVPGNELAIKLGQMEQYWIYRSDLPESGDFNLLLVVKFASTDDLAPNKKRYEEFMKEFTQQKSDEGTDFAQKNYPAMRELTGSYLMREIKITK